MDKLKTDCNRQAGFHARVGPLHLPWKGRDEARIQFRNAKAKPRQTSPKPRISANFKAKKAAVHAWTLVGNPLTVTAKEAC